MKYNTIIIIGIDPDTVKSGFALLDVRSKQLYVKALEFPRLIDHIRWYYEKSIESNSNLIVVVEAGWLNTKSNFHGQTGSRAQRIAKNVGSNHQTGKHIVEMCEWIGVETVLQKPLNKGWNGANGKITHAELDYFANIEGRTSQDGRDAALIAWNYAGLPIRVKAK